MLKIPGYRHKEKLYQDAHTTLHRATRSLDDSAVLIKTLSMPFPSPAELKALIQEYEITSQLEISGTIEPICLESSHHAIVFKDCGGEPTRPDTFFATHGLEGFVRFAMAVVDIIAACHQQEVIHRNLRPGNILHDPHTGQVVILGMSNASLKGENVSEESLLPLLDSLIYAAPEQTGRLGRKVGPATDLYALGITFYELLTGNPPFVSEDPVEVVHAHLAREAVPVIHHNNKVGEVLSNIVGKLLNKTPEERYRGAYGLKVDLETCLDQLTKSGDIAPFEIASKDVPHHFDMPDKLYSREPELQTMISLFDKVSRGHSCLLTVKGPSGIGKTALVDELGRSIARWHGFFVSGRCERTQKEIPYQAFIQAFRALAHQVLAESPHNLRQWREKLLEALGTTGALIIEVVPELQLIIGEQPELPSLDTVESRIRFQVALLKFIGVFAGKKHPLVIFLDDLQWAGPSSVDLIKALLSSRTTPYLFLIGAYRPELEKATFVLDKFQKDLGSGGFISKTLQLQDIDLIDIQEILLDALGIKPDRSRSLAELVYDQTNGNPLFVRLYLNYLYHEGLLTFRSDRGLWDWDGALIGANRGKQTDVQSLIMAKLGHLEPETLKLLTLASCIGSRFSLEMLSVAYQHTPTQTLLRLIPAVREGLIRVVNTTQPGQTFGPQKTTETKEDTIPDTYEFLHGRVEETIYDLMGGDNIKITHLRVGQLFLKHSQAHVLGDRVFSVVNQLNYGRELLEDTDERLELARLNLTAGIKARDAVAYQDALEYFRISWELLPQAVRELDYQLWLTLSMQMGEMYYFQGKTQLGDERFQGVLKHAAHLKDKALVYETKVLLLTNLSRLEDAVSTGLEGLALFGIEVPFDPKSIEAEITHHLISVRQFLSQHSMTDILAMHDSENEDMLHCANLFTHITPPAFNTNQTLFKLITLRQVEQAMRHGHTRFSAYAYASLGILMGILGDYRQGYELAQMALELNQAKPDPFIRNRLLFISCNLINHWCRHVKVDLAVLQQVYHHAENSGDLVYANYALLVLAHHRWFLQEPLLRQLDESEQRIVYAEQTRNDAALATHRFLSHAILNLRGLSMSASTLDTKTFSVKDNEQTLIKASYFTGVSICRIIKLEILFIRGCYQEALQQVSANQQYLSFCDNIVMVVLHHYYHALSLTALGRGKEGKDRDILDGTIVRFKHWAENCPANFRHKMLLLMAQRARLDGHDQSAMNYYRDAIRGALDQGFIADEALGHELAAGFFLERGFSDYGAYHVQTALSRYDEWGALARVEELCKIHARVLQAHGHQTGKLAVGSHGFNQSLDKITLLKAAEAISGEIRIDNLLSKMMVFVVEHACAQRGVFIFHDSGQLMVEAEWHVNWKEVAVIHDLPLSGREDLARPTIHYVFRTRSDLLIADVGRDKQFAGDSYLEESGVRSVLCIPVLRNTDLLGILYLENHLVSNAFTTERLEMLRLLTPQMAIALQNARYIAGMAALNETLKVEVEEREKAEKAVKKAQEIAVANAHNAGKAEFANSVLHNINNVLNTVNLACETMREANQTSKIKNLGRAMKLILENKDNLGDYLTTDKRGQVLPGYLTGLTKVLEDEHDLCGEELEVLHQHIRLMKDIIRTQQVNAKGALSHEALDLILLIEDGLRLQEQGLIRHKIEVVRNYNTEEPVQAQRAELTHILINLFKNAIEAMGLQKERVLTVTTNCDEQDRVYLSVRDTGGGIEEEDMKQMFTHGFTTKEDGHGFGLHFCAKAMREMDGKIEVFSEGKGKGATFRLTFAKPKILA